MKRSYRWDPAQKKLVEITRPTARPLSAAYVGDRTLATRARARGLVPVEEFPRISADCMAERERRRIAEKPRRARTIAEVVNSRYRFT